MSAKTKIGALELNNTNGNKVGSSGLNNNNSSSSKIESSDSNRIALCLSGGGFRAFLCHLGMLRRLHEWGILPKIDVISSVSGGAILAALYGLAVNKNGGPEYFDFAGFEREMVNVALKGCRDEVMALRMMTSQTQTAQRILKEKYEECFFKGARLSDLPMKPRIIFNSTCLNNGEMIHFTSDYVGHQRKYAWYNGSSAHSLLETTNMQLATAVAASSAVPLVFPPVLLEVQGGKMTLVDGAIKDNLGISPLFPSVWNQHFCCDHIISADASEPIEKPISEMEENTATNESYGRTKLALQAINIMMHEKTTVVQDLLKEMIKSNRVASTMFFKLASPSLFNERYPFAFAENKRENETIWMEAARVRTDLDRFSPVECATLTYMGYTMINQRLLQYGTHIIRHKSNYPELGADIETKRPGKISSWARVLLNVAGRPTEEKEVTETVVADAEKAMNIPHMMTWDEWRQHMTVLTKEKIPASINALHRHLSSSRQPVAALRWFSRRYL